VKPDDIVSDRMRAPAEQRTFAGREPTGSPDGISTLLVEFVGLPGAGKSTVARCLSEAASADGIPTSRYNLIGYYSPAGERLTRREIRWDRIVSVIGQPGLALGVIACAMREGGGEGLSWMINLCRRNRAAAEIGRGPGLRILEEGPLNALCLAAATRSRPWNLRRALASLNKPDVVVALSVPEDVAMDRIARRAGVLSDRPVAQLGTLLHRLDRTLTTMLAHVGVPVLSYDTTREPPEGVARRILGDLARTGTP